ncbi:MAG: hypothetical protein AVDCRST_MAG10-632, partial [uncultured Acidimicrobiales bacterium]
GDPDRGHLYAQGDRDRHGGRRLGRQAGRADQRLGGRGRQHAVAHRQEGAPGGHPHGQAGLHRDRRTPQRPPGRLQPGGEHHLAV